MGRSGYVDDCDDQWAAIRWQGALASSIRGKRGQAFFRELIDALDAMPVKRLIPNDLRKDGEVCALGAVGAKRGMNLESLDPHEAEVLSGEFGIAEPLVREIEYRNDEGGPWDRPETPEERWTRMRAWAVNKLKTDSEAGTK
jgi:hypothetical protein